MIELFSQVYNANPKTYVSANRENEVNERCQKVNKKKIL